MGLFSPKYPEGTEPQKKEPRGARKDREFRERLDKQCEDGFKNARRVSKERSAKFWEDYEREHGAGSVGGSEIVQIQNDRDGSLVGVHPEEIAKR